MNSGFVFSRGIACMLILQALSEAVQREIYQPQLATQKTDFQWTQLTYESYARVVHAHYGINDALLFS